MGKHKICIINFLFLDAQKYNEILNYRNKEFVRKVSLNQNFITEEEHKKYHQLLENKDSHFAFLITKNDCDYGVITLKKIDETTYYIGDYLVDENYKFEGGGIVTNYCLLYVLNKMNIKFINYLIQKNNTRSKRIGEYGNIISKNEDNEFYDFKVEISDFNSPYILNLKSRQLFDKMYYIDKILD